MNSIQSIINLLRSDNYITTNKTLSRKIGLVPATIYAEMLSKYYYYQQNNQLKDGYFYLTIPTLTDEIGLTREQQDTAINKLIKLGLIEKKVAKLKGDEAPKRYFKIVDNVALVLEYFQDKQEKTPSSIDNTGFVGNTQNDMSEKHKTNSGFPTPNRNKELDYINNIQSINQEDPTLEEIFEQSRVNTFEDDEVKETIKQAIKELHTDADTRQIIKRVKIEHITDANTRYKFEFDAGTQINDPMQYYKAILIKCINHGGLGKLFKA